MINQKTNPSMNNFLNDELSQRLDLQVETRLEWNALLTSEILALKRLRELGSETRNYVPMMIHEEIQRRQAFLEELMNNF
jgi:hypothetical protein